MNNIASRIIGTGSYLPSRILTNHDVEKLTDTSDEWIKKRSGIAQRHIAEEDTATSDLGAEAAMKAIKNAGISAEDIDLIIFATMTSDYLFPSAACLLQYKIGAHKAAAYDLNAACTGFIYALSMADAVIKSGTFRTVLIVGADLMSKRILWEKRDTAVLFGDGAGAILLRREENSDNGVLMTHIGADGGGYDLLYLPAGGSKHVIRPENIDRLDLGIVMSGRELFKKAVHIFSEATQFALQETGMTIDDIDLFVPHQANTRIIYHVADHIGIPREKCFVNIDQVANTVAGTIPIALDEARQRNLIKEGSIVLLAAFGAGLTWGSSIIRW